MAIAMTSPSPFFRTFSNKENSSFATSHLLQPAFTSSIASSSTRKPRIGGIGKAPKRTAPHSAKPYDRRASVVRAKARATSPAKGEEKKASRRKAAPSPIITSVPMVQSSARAQPQVRIANIPVRLPRPRIPPVYVLPGEMSHIPIEWALPRLRAHFPALLAVSAQFRPQPDLTRPADPSSSQRTFAFAIPQLAAGTEAASDLEAKVKGRQPDICLAIKGKGKEDGAARLLPVNCLVYASQCSYWPAHDPSTAPECAPSPLAAIDEEPSEEESEADSDGTVGTVRPAQSIASASSSSSASSSPPADPHILHLPLLSLTIPHPASFPALHTHLHLPTRSLVPSLLGLPATCLSGADATRELGQLPMDALMAKLEYMHGFWSNLCALGISSEGSWRGLSEAWGLVVGQVASRSRRVGEEVRPEV